MSPFRWELSAIWVHSTNISWAPIHCAKHYMECVWQIYEKLELARLSEFRTKREKGLEKNWNLLLGNLGELNLAWVATTSKKDSLVSFRSHQLNQAINPMPSGRRGICGIIWSGSKSLSWSQAAWVYITDLSPHSTLAGFLNPSISQFPTCTVAHGIVARK